MENYNKELEKKLLEAIKEKEASDKRLLKLEVFVGILSCIVIFVPVFLAALLPIQEDWMRAVLAFCGLIPGGVGLCMAVRLEQVAGYYECKVCGHRYVPTYKAVSMAPHLGRTRKMRCPACGKKSWQKKVISKE